MLRNSTTRPEEEERASPGITPIRFGYPSSHGGGFRFDDDRAPVSRPAWDDSNIEDDTVLRAFEAHASAYEEDDSPRPVAPVLHDLLGDDAEDVLAEASDAAGESQYFGRMQGWAPQRPGGHTVYPWEVDRDQPSREPDDRDDEDSDDWSGGGSQPPWSGGDMVSPAPHAGAPSARHRSRSKMLVREIAETGLLALLVFLAVRASFQNFKVDGLSMWPTLEDGEYLIVNKLAYAEVDMERLSNFVPFVDPGENPNREVFGGPERGDIVVLKDPAEPDIDLIKRIIGMPGETLEIVDGKVYINDHLLIEPYIKHEWHDAKPKIAIPDGYYFVMGDNRDNSKDSRNGSIGLIPKDLIIGKAMLTYWPRDKFGLAPNQEGDISAKDGRPQIAAQTVEP
jgi:signal peptidase I